MQPLWGEHASVNFIAFHASQRHKYSGPETTGPKATRAILLYVVSRKEVRLHTVPTAISPYARAYLFFRLKCNRAHPCSNCHKRDLGASCCYVAGRTLQAGLEHRPVALEYGKSNTGYQEQTSNTLLSPSSGSEFINLSHWRTMMKDVVSATLRN